ncbi:MAG: MFS transporter [Spirochaetes bacterium]|nr:MFS transporter [Spirochaetota bacterium]
MKRFSPIFYRLALANFLFFMGNSLFILFPVYLKSLGAPESFIGFMNGIDKIFIIAAAAAIGTLMQGRDPVKLLRLGYCVCAVAFASYMTITEASWLVLPVRMLHGIGFSLSMILGTTIIFGSVKMEDAVEAIGLYGITGAITNALSPFLGETLVAYGCPYRFVFLLAALLVLASLGITFFIHPAGGHAPGAPRRASGAVRLLGDRRFLMVSVTTLIFGGIFGVIITYLPNYVRASTDYRFSWFFITYIAVLVAIRFTLLRAVNRTNRSALIMAAFGAGVMTCLILNCIRYFPLFLMTGVLYGITHGVLYPVMNTVTVSIVPEHDRGGANALFTAFFSGGSMVFSFGLGHLIDYTGTYLAAFNFCAAAGGVAMAIIAAATLRYGPRGLSAPPD